MGLADGIGLAAVVVAIAVGAWQVMARRTDIRRAATQAAERRIGAEVRVADDLVRWLVGRRVLWEPAIREIPHEAIESVLKIRERVDADTGQITDPRAREALETIRAACLKLLSQPRPVFQTFFSPEAAAALDAFRRRVHPGVQTLVRVYSLAPPRWPEYRGGFEGEGVAIYIPRPDKD